MRTGARSILIVVAFFLVPWPAPAAEASAPANVFASPLNVHTQVSSVGVDAAGRYGLAAVYVDPSAILPPPADSGKFDLYSYSFATGSEQWHARHAYSAVPPNMRDTTLTANQVVAAAAGDCSDCTATYFAVGGPSGTISRWNAASQAPDWERKVGNKGHVDAVAITSDGARVYAGENLNNGTLHVYDGATGTESWEMTAVSTTSTDANGPAIHVIAVSRTGNLGLVGTSSGIFRFNPLVTSRPTPSDLYAADIGSVTSIALARDGSFAVVGTDTGGVYFFRLQDLAKNAPLLWSRTCGKSATDAISEVAIALDGSRFAAGSKGGTLCIYDRLDSDAIAQLHEDPINTGNQLNSLAMSGDGTLVVVGVDTLVAAYHIKRALPIWTVDITTQGLTSETVQSVAMSDDGRIVFVGTGAGTNTASAVGHVLALRATYAAAVTVEGGLVQSAAPGDIAQYLFDVTNKGSTPDTYSFLVDRPAGFSGDLPKAVTLLPEESARVPVNISVAPGHAPGQWTTEVRVTSAALTAFGGCADSTHTTCNPLADEKLNLTVARVSNVKLESDEKQLSLNAGQELTFPFNVRNTGNAPADVNLTVQQFPVHGASWRVRFDNDRVSVNPNQVVQATAFITAPATAADGDSNEIHIHGDVGPAFAADLVVTARVNPQFKLDLVANTTSVSVAQGESAFIKLTLTNRGNTDDTVNASYQVLPVSAALDWHIVLDRTDNIQSFKSSALGLTLRINPTSATAPDATVTVTVTSQGSGDSQKVTISMTETPPPAPKSGFLPAPPLFLVLAATALAAFAYRPARSTSSRIARRVRR
ncbi:MAG: outer membrane protein assembly factor BamB family protein [Thermoplasmatota archaeon]